MVDGSGLENHRVVYAAPWVRIPLPPLGGLGRCQSGRMGPPAKRLSGGNARSQVRILFSPHYVLMFHEVVPTEFLWALLL